MAGSHPDQVVSSSDVHEGNPRPGNRILLRLVLLLIAVLAIADVVVFKVVANRSSQSTDNANIEGDQVIVSAQISGRIASLGKEERAPIARGDILVLLDDRSLKEELQQAIADRDLADQNVALAKLKLDEATENLQRAAAELQNKVIPQKQYDGFALEKAYAEAQLRVAQALVGLDNAHVAAEKSNLERAVIKSPITGIVAKKWVSVGDAIQPSQALYSLFDLNSIWVSAFFTKEQNRRIVVGDQAEISVDAFPDVKLAGKVVYVGAETTSQSSFTPLDNTSGNFARFSHSGPVTIAFDNASFTKLPFGKTLIPGMTAKVRVITVR